MQSVLFRNIVNNSNLFSKKKYLMVLLNSYQKTPFFDSFKNAPKFAGLYVPISNAVPTEI